MMDSTPTAAAAADDAVAQLDARLSRARLTAASARGVVKVIYNGHGDGLSMELKTDARRQYDAQTLAGYTTTALQAADRTLEALHQHAFGELRIHGTALAEYRAAKASAGQDVVRCFG